MSEEFLKEHDFNEEVIPQEEPGLYLGVKEDKLERFQELLAKRLNNTVDQLEMVQAVVMAAIEAEGLELSRPEVIVEAVMANPEIRKEAVRFAESIMKRNIQ